jgi:tyrosine-specific transport protein
MALAASRAARLRAHLPLFVLQRRAAVSTESESSVALSREAAAVPDASAVWGASVLVAGTTVGAGILALPAVTAPAGLAPSLVSLTGVWLLSIATGLFLAEVTARATADGEESPSFVSLARRTLGSAGGFAAIVTQFFLQETLMVAYASKGGEVLVRLGIVSSSPAQGEVLFVLTLSTLCALASPQQLDRCNGGLLAALTLSFVLLLTGTLPNVQSASLAFADWPQILPALPVISLSFVYHNVVPILVRSLRGHAPSVRAALWQGTALPFAMYLLWEVAVLGSAAPAAGADPLSRSSPIISAFSLLAVATSYLGFVLSLSDMIADLGRGGRPDAEPRPPGALAGVPAKQLLQAVLPPLAASILFPGVFLSALEVAGVFGALTLGGWLPGVMVLAERRKGGEREPSPLAPPGGDAAPALVAALAAATLLGDVFGGLRAE